MDNDQKYYDQVAQEISNRIIDPGLWARALADTGDEGAKAKARYINLRVKNLKIIEHEYVARTREEAQKRKTYPQCRSSLNESVEEGPSEAKILFFIVGFVVLILLLSVSGL